MPVRVKNRSAPFRLGAARVGNAVSGAHGQRMGDDAGFLLAHAVESIADVGLDLDTGTTTPLALSIFYARSPGVSALLVGTELMMADSATATVTWTNAGAAMTWIAPNGLDGASALGVPSTATSIPRMYHGVVDVTGMPTDGTLQRLNVGYVRTSNAKGLLRVFAREIPQAQTDPAGTPSTEVGLNPAWAVARLGAAHATTGLVDGSASTSLGFVRFEQQLELARTSVRVFRQWCTYEDDTYAPSRTSTTIGDFTWPVGGAYTPTFVTRGRRLYGTTTGTAVAENATAVVRYKCSDAAGGTIRITTYDGATTTNNDYAVVAAAGWTTASLGAITLPTGAAAGTQRLTVTVQGAVAAAGTLRVANVTIYTSEPP